MPGRKSYRSQLQKVKLLLLDVDGVMTDGGIYYAESGDEFKKFDIRDGYGLVKLQRAGVRVGIITGRVSKLVARRAQELGIEEVHQNLENKLVVYQELIRKLRLTDDEVAFIGDDEFDIPVLKRVGFSAAPSDATPKVRKTVHVVCKHRGGEGVVREIVELLLESRGVES